MPAPRPMIRTTRCACTSTPAAAVAASAVVAAAISTAASLRCRSAALRHRAARPPATSIPTTLSISRRPRHAGVTSRRTDGLCYGAGRLFLLDSRQLHHLAPAVGLGGEHAAELTCIAMQRDGAELGDAGLDPGVGQSRVDLAIEQVN